MDYYPGPFDQLGRNIRHGVQSYVARIPGVLIGIAEDAVRRELSKLRDDIEGALEYIASLPDPIRNAVAYEFFASFFSHYLPKKLLNHYIYEHGWPLELTEKEMIDCAPYINLMNCKDVAVALRSAKPVSELVAIKASCPAASLTNGTLGQFSVLLDGKLEIEADGHWKIRGKMSFSDTWDFDPKDFKTGGRSVQGEIKTRFANVFLPGLGFKVTSVEVDFEQTDADDAVSWVGGAPVASPDRLAGLDIALKSLE